MKINPSHQMSLSHLNHFLSEGAIVSLSETHCLLAWGGSARHFAAHESQPSFYIPDFFMQDPQPWCHFPQQAMVTKEELLRLLQGVGHISRSNLRPPRLWQAPCFEEFKQAFKLIQNKIYNNHLLKAVPVVRESSKGLFSIEEKKQMLKQILSSSKPLQIYGWWNQQEGLLGFTPEILFKYDFSENLFSTMALAGTQSKGQSLLNDPKELKEHQLVVEDLCSLLHSHHLILNPTYEWEIGSLQHLRTDISVNLETEFEFEQWVQKMHPTPALGVYPRGDWQWLQQVSPVQRRRFGAPFGVNRPQQVAQVLVAIRNIEWYEGQSFVSAGCGLVEMSQLESEWNELKLKRDFIKKYLEVDSILW